MSNLNDSTCNLNYIELKRNLVIGQRKAQMLLLLYFPSLLANTTYMALYSLKIKLLYFPSLLANTTYMALYSLKIKLKLLETFQEL